MASTQERICDGTGGGFDAWSGYSQSSRGGAASGTSLVRDIDVHLQGVQQWLRDGPRALSRARDVVPGGPKGTSGTIIFPNQSASLKQDAAVGSAFARGYVRCLSRHYKRAGYHIALVLSSNNSTGSSNVGSASGKAWGRTVKSVASYVHRKRYDNRVRIAGGSDIEPGFGPPAPARAFVHGFTSTTTALFYNTGSADGCPQAPANGNGSCNGGWRQGDIYYVSWGRKHTGALSEHRAEPSSLSANAAWNALRDALNKYHSAAQASPPAPAPSSDPAAPPDDPGTEQTPQPGEEADPGDSASPGDDSASPPAGVPDGPAVPDSSDPGDDPGSADDPTLGDGNDGPDQDGADAGGFDDESGQDGPNQPASPQRPEPPPASAGSALTPPPGHATGPAPGPPPPTIQPTPASPPPAPSATLRKGAHRSSHLRRSPSPSLQGEGGAAPVMAGEPPEPPLATGPTGRPLVSGLPGNVSSGSSSSATHSKGVARHPGQRTHVVKSGESLWSISRDMLGSRASDAAIARGVDQIWQLNAAQMATGNPDLILPGQALRLPGEPA